MPAPTVMNGSTQQSEPGGRPAMSRRHWLAGAGAVGAFWADRAKAGGRKGDVATIEPPTFSINRYAPPPMPLEHRLAHRMSCGATDSEFALADLFGFEDYLEYHLDHLSINDNETFIRLAPLTTLVMSPSQLLDQPGGLVVSELINATLIRQIYSRRQLFERMVEFWTDHFNVHILTGLGQYLKTVDDRDVIREHALGTFPELLRASAASPAMLFYLDNYTSVRGNPNENYARELLELHTVGVDNGYTQQDIVEVARCFTGWTIDFRGGPNRGRFVFDPNRHDFDAKRVLGFDIPAGGGIQDAERVIEILTLEPSVAPLTARFVGGKMANWLWGYNPPEGLLDDVVAAYMNTGGDIKAMIRAILSPQWLAVAPLKYKRPLHYLMSAVRAMNLNITNYRAMTPIMQAAGQVPYYWSAPDGYPDTLDFWSGLVLPRWNFGAAAAAGQLLGITFNVNQFLNGAQTAADVTARIDRLLFGGHMERFERRMIEKYLEPDLPPLSRIQEAIGLAAGSPGFQWY